MPYKIGDPNHIEVHNALVDDTQTLANAFGVAVILPDTANLGDLGHTSDHNLIVAALDKIATEGNPGIPVASGGAESTYVGDGTDGTTLGVTYKVHRFTTTGLANPLVVSIEGSCDYVMVGGGGGGGATGGGGGGGDFIRGSLWLDVGTVSVYVGPGGGVNNPGSASTIEWGDTRVAAVGGGSGGPNGGPQSVGRDGACGGGAGGHGDPGAYGTQTGGRSLDYRGAGGSNYPQVGIGPSGGGGGIIGAGANAVAGASGGGGGGLTFTFANGAHWAGYGGGGYGGTAGGGGGGAGSGGVAATPNVGGGGGGNAAGGSGVVIIRYPVI